MKYCEQCNRNVEPVKKPINILALIVCMCTFIGIVPYIVWRIIFVKKNKCPICGCKVKSLSQRPERKQARKELNEKIGKKIKKIIS